MKKVLAIALCVLAAVGNGWAQAEQCFENEGLKMKQRVSFVVLGGVKVEGTFENVGYDDATSGEMFGFFGTKKGSQLTIKFAGNAPYELPPKTKSIVWTLGATSLKIPMYGKNYDTNKFAAYTATFAECGGN